MGEGERQGYVHSMNELSKGDRFQKCLNCGSEEHRAKDCDRPNKAGKSGPKEQTPKPTTQVAQVTPSTSVASPSQSVVQATPVLSPELLHQAAEMYRQLQALHAPQATHPEPLQAPQATQPLPLPAPAPSGSHQPSGTSQPSIKRMAINSIMPASCFASLYVESPNLGGPNPPSQAENGGLGGPEARFKGENGHICPTSTFSALNGMKPCGGSGFPCRRQFNIDAPHAVGYFAPPAAREGWQCATHCANGGCDRAAWVQLSVVGW